METKKFSIHFVGIGGIGMSGLAHVLTMQGHTVSGCDKDLSQKSILHLQSIGCSIIEGHGSPECTEKTYDCLVYSSMTAHHQELVIAQKKGTFIVHRSIILAELMKKYKSIAITGSHGKTTTSALISHILIESHYDPTIIIGGHFTGTNCNARFGKGAYLVAEADESDRSLLHLFPSIAVITNISPEHLDVYENVHDITHTMQLFINRLPFDGTAIIGIDNPHLQTLLPQKNHRVITFGFHQSADVIITIKELQPQGSTFTIRHNNIDLGLFSIQLPGKHSLLNAAAAYAAAYVTGIPLQDIKKAIASFNGVERRFSFRGTFNNALVYDDYGHHPVEIENSLKVARQTTTGPLTVVFQPHRFTRTAFLWNDFITTFLKSSIDHLIITDIHAASEQAIDTISSHNLVEAIKKQHPSFSLSYVPLDDNFEAIKLSLKNLSGGTLLFQGAGSLNRLAELISHK